MHRGYVDGGPLDGEFVAAENGELICYVSSAGPVFVGSYPDAAAVRFGPAAAEVCYRWRWGVWLVDGPDVPACSAC